MELLLEWLRLLLRWAHVIAGIMWIGDSLLFMWIDSHLNPDPQKRADVTGVTWLIHGGGYYTLEKRMLEPGRLPPKLRWFWLEATSTWVSGFLLLVLIYYWNADLFLIDRSVSKLTGGQAIAASLALLAVSWFAYDGMWRIAAIHDNAARRPGLEPWSSLWGLPGMWRSGNTLIFSMVSLVGVVYATTHLFSGRAAFIQIGAMLGTIMAANVWVHIIPPQLKMLRQAREGRPVDFSLGAHARTRSTHNTYLTFPVIFLMISQHFPQAFARPWSWLILCLFIVFGAGVRRLMIAGVRGDRWSAAATLVSAAALVYFTALPALSGTTAPGPGSTPAAPPFVDVRAIIVQRCAVCHSATPTMPGIASAPNGMMLDTPAQIQSLAVLIKIRAVDQKTMPPGNITHITDEERAVLRRWVDAGAPLK